MTRVRPSELKSGEEKALLQKLYRSVAKLDGEKEISRFFSQLLTRSEAIMISRRIEIATLLMSGETYEEIRIQTKAAKGTILNIQKWLDEEDNACSTATSKILQEEVKRKIFGKNGRSLIRSEILQDIKRRHPVRFLLLNLLDK